MKKKEAKKLTKDQAVKDIDKLKKDLFNFRFQKVNGQLTSPSKINQTKNKLCYNQLEQNLEKHIKEEFMVMLLDATS